MPPGNRAVPLKTDQDGTVHRHRHDFGIEIARKLKRLVGELELISRLKVLRDFVIVDNGIRAEVLVYREEASPVGYIALSNSEGHTHDLGAWGDAKEDRLADHLNIGQFHGLREAVVGVERSVEAEIAVSNSAGFLQGGRVVEASRDYIGNMRVESAL